MCEQDVYLIYLYINDLEMKVYLLCSLCKENECFGPLTP